MLCIWEDLSATVCAQALVSARAGESLDRAASSEGKATRVTSGAQQPGQLLSAKAGLGAQPLGSGQGLSARCVRGCEFLRPSPLLHVQRKDWRPSDLLELNASAMSASQKLKSVLKKDDH